jgi:uncharacterized membrane protein
MTQEVVRKRVARIARQTISTLARNWLRKHLFFLAKLPIMALGLVAVLMTTNALDTVKTMWAASHVAATAYKQASRIKQPQQAK